MEALRSTTSAIKARGQLTIPKKIREAGNLEEGQEVTIIPLGDAIIVTRKRLELDEARRKIRKIVKESGLSLKEILSDLAEERKEVYGKTYGKKGR